MVLESFTQTLPSPDSCRLRCSRVGLGILFYELLAALLLPMLLLLLETLAEETIISIMSSCPPTLCAGSNPGLGQARHYLGLTKQDTILAWPSKIAQARLLRQS